MYTRLLFNNVIGHHHPSVYRTALRFHSSIMDRLIDMKGAKKQQKKKRAPSNNSTATYLPEGGKSSTARV